MAPQNSRSKKKPPLEAYRENVQDAAWLVRHAEVLTHNNKNKMQSVIRLSADRLAEHRLYLRSDPAPDLPAPVYLVPRRKLTSQNGNIGYPRLERYLNRVGRGPDLNAGE